MFFTDVQLVRVVRNVRNEDPEDLEANCRLLVESRLLVSIPDWLGSLIKTSLVSFKHHVLLERR